MCENGNHRLEFRQNTEGMTTYICLDCGEQIIQYEENHGC